MLARPPHMLLALLCAAVACGGDHDRDGIADRDDRCARTARERTVDAQGCSAVAHAFERGRNALLGFDAFQVGELWVLQQVLALEPHPPLEALIAQWVEKLRGDPFERQINPRAPPATLPESPGRGIRRLFSYIQAPFGTPPERRLAYIRSYLDAPARGYVLTHQYLMLPWAKEQGITLPPDLVARGPELLARIAEEQQAASEFNDLYAERAALLLAFDKPAHEQVERWIDMLLSVQLSDGSWQDPSPSVLEFDAQEGEAFHSRSHTSAFALWCLALYGLG